MDGLCASSPEKLLLACFLHPKEANQNTRSLANAFGSFAERQVASVQPQLYQIMFARGGLAWKTVQ
jgi:hypothetical protein